MKGSGSEKHLTRAVGYAIERKRGERTLRRMARQQSAVAGLGQRALATIDTQALLLDAAAVVSGTLDCGHSRDLRMGAGREPAGAARRGGLGQGRARPDGRRRGRVDGHRAGPSAHAVGRVRIGRRGGAVRVPAVVRRRRGRQRRVRRDPRRRASIRRAGRAPSARHGSSRNEDVQFLELVAHVVGSAISREQVEEVFRVSEAGYRHILDTASEGICAMNADGQMTYVNRRAAEMLGYDSPDTLLGRPIFEFMFEEDRTATAEVIESWKGGVQNQFDLRLRCLDGAELWVLASTSPILDQAGDFGGALVMFTDVTARRTAEKALRESEARYRRIVETANEGIWMTDAAWRTEYVNRVMAETPRLPRRGDGRPQPARLRRSRTIGSSSGARSGCIARARGNRSNCASGAKAAPRSG